MAWRVEFDPKALDDLSKLDKQTQRRIAKFLRERIAVDENPRRLGGPLHGEKKVSGNTVSAPIDLSAT